MNCPKCKSENVSASVINEVTMKNKHHGILWWVFWGWYWVPLKWLVFTVPALIGKIFGSKKQKAVNKRKTIYVCQSCGHQWEI